MQGFIPRGCLRRSFPLAVPGSGERSGWKGRESRQGLSRLPALGIVTGTSLDAVAVLTYCKGRRWGDVAVKGWGTVHVSARVELIFFTENRAPYELL